MLRAFEDLGIRKDEVVRIVMNRYLKKSEITLKDAWDGLQMKPFWVVPNDFQKTMSSINQGKPLVHASPKAGPARSLRELAEFFAAGQEQTRKERWRFMV